MKRTLCVICLIALVIGMFSGCGTSAPKEGNITFKLQEDSESLCTWEYFVEPEGALRKTHDEIKQDDDGLLMHEWIFEGVTAGDAGITFQYSEDGEDPIRTVHYDCVVGEDLSVGLLETVDSADEAGTAGDELLLRSISAILALQFGHGMNYPDGEVENSYAAEFLICYANLHHFESAEAYDAIQDTGYERYIALREEVVEEVLNVTFGDRFGTDRLLTDNTTVIYNGHQYYFAVKDVASAVAVPIGEDAVQPEYVFTVTGGAEGIDGSARVATTASAENSAGLSIKSISAQKN